MQISIKCSIAVHCLIFIHEAKGKAHLSPVGGGQAAGDGLTDEIIQNYRKYNPKWTREQIAAFHRSYAKE